MIAFVFELGVTALMSLGFVFMAALMVRGVVKAVRGEQIIPTEIPSKEADKLLAVEKAAREVNDPDGPPDKNVSLTVALHELDAVRTTNRVRELDY